MQKWFMLLLLTGLLQQVNAQNYSITGRLVDAREEKLPSATVLVLSASDSTMVNYALSDSEGVFHVRNLPRQPYLMRITFVGLGTKYMNILPPQGEVLDLGEILMEDEQTILGEVSIEGERISMFLRGDTIEYDALAFGGQPNEVVEDLLKRLPGIEVDPDGTIRAQGEQVRRVLVDGREFFGRDPQMATQNLPANAVSRVHVFDERSEQSKFTGIDDGERERTMNLELKEEHRQGVFGNSSLGYGPDNRFQGRTNLNRFEPKGQLSVLGMGNNLNQQGFSIGEYMNFSGGAQSMMGGAQGGAVRINMALPTGMPINMGGASSNGIMTSWAGGVNFNRTLGQSTELSSSYFYNQLEHNIDQQLERENFLPSGSYDYLQQNNQDNTNNNHRLTLRMDHKFSESSSLLFDLSGTTNSTSSDGYSDSQTYRNTGLLQNSSEQSTLSEGNSLNFQSSLLWRQRLSKPGRTISVRLNMAANDNDRDYRLQALNLYYQGVDDVRHEMLLQDNLQASITRTLGSNITYTEPLGNRRFLELNHRITRNLNEVDQRVYDIEEGQNILNEQLTNIYNNTHLYQRGGLNVLVNRDNYNFTLGAYLQGTSLKGELETFGHEISENFFHVLPLVRFNYDFNNFRRLSINYETSVQEPSVRQLQPILDNRDPLNIYMGNPDLDPSYRNRLTARFNSFNPLSQFGFFVFATAEYVQDAITNAVNTDDFLVRTTIPVNTKDNLNLTGNANMNFRIPKLKSRFMVGSTVSSRQSTNILDAVEQRITNNMISGNFRLTFIPVDQFETVLSANVNRQLTQYQFSTLEQAYVNQTYGAELNWRFLDHYRFNVSYRYQIYEGRTSEFDQKIPMLEFGFSRRFLRNNSGELRFSGFNVLDREMGVTQSVNANYLEQLVSNSLGRYFLLSFTYSLNRSLNVFDRVGGGGGMGRAMHAL